MYKANDNRYSVLIGASKTEQLLDNINATKNTSFTKEELEKIENIALG